MEKKNQIDYLVYYRDVSNRHSEAVRRLIDLYLDLIKRGYELSEAGEKVIWSGVSPQIVYACDAIPISAAEIARVGSEDSVALAEREFLVPNETCAMVKAMIGELYKYKDTSFTRLAQTPSDCEPVAVSLPLIRDMGFDVHTYDVGLKNGSDPKRADALREKFRKEIDALSRWISGKSINREKLAAELARYNRIQHKIRRILDKRLKHTTYMLSLPTMILLAGNADYWGDPIEYESIVDQLLAEFEQLREGEYNDAETYVIWAGARGQEFGAYETLDNCKASITGWSIPNNLRDDYNLEKDPVEAFIDFVLGEGHGGSDVSTGEIEKLIKTTGAKGVILYGFLGCSYGSIDIELKKDHFKKINIPTVSLMGAFQIGATAGQTATRIEAFLEMLS